jgi:polyisoprenoid-binding protein YceI
MKRFTTLFLALFILLAGSQSVLANSRVWEIDKYHSNFYFSISHIFSKVHGHFNDYSGEVRFDPANLAESRFYFEIKTNSVDTNIGKRDKDLQSARFFDSVKYPLMIFESIKITDVGDGLFEVQGKFTVKGQVYDLVLPLTLAGIKDHQAAKGKEVIGFNGKVTIDRLAYKIGDGKMYDMGLLGKDVEIVVTLEGLSSK